MKNSFTIIVAGASPIYTESLAMAISAVNGFSVVGSWSERNDLSGISGKVSADMLLVDMLFNGEDASLWLKSVIRDNPKLKVLAMADSKNMHQMGSALDVGVHSVQLKNMSIEDIAAAMNSLMAGKGKHAEAVMRLIDLRNNSFTPVGLSPREVHIMQLLAQGKSARDMGEMMEISARTVETHKANIMRKLNVKKATHLVKIAFDRGYAKTGG